MRPGTRAARMRWRVSSSSITPLTLQGAGDRTAFDLAVWTPVTAAWAGVEGDQIGIDLGGRGLAPAGGDQFHAADGAAIPGLVRLDPGVHGALIDLGLGLGPRCGAVILSAWRRGGTGLLPGEPVSTRGREQAQTKDQRGFDVHGSRRTGDRRAKEYGISP